MKRYAIADYLTDEQRAAILGHRYARPGEYTGETDAEGEPVVFAGDIPADVDDWQTCPLGHLPIGQPTPTNYLPAAPTASDVAFLVIRDMDPGERFAGHDTLCEAALSRGTFGNAWCGCDDRLESAVKDAAEEFIADWDAGKIAPDQLATALGAPS